LGIAEPIKLKECPLGGSGLISAANRVITRVTAVAPPSSLKIGLAWFVPGVMPAVVYLFVVYRSFAGKVGVLDNDGY
jgi:hypothetical protein